VSPIFFPYTTLFRSEVTRKVEDAVSNIVGIENIQSTVRTGNSSTAIEFQFGTDISQAMDDVRDAVSRIRPDLPLDATEPYISRRSEEHTSELQSREN